MAPLHRSKAETPPTTTVACSDASLTSLCLLAVSEAFFSTKGYAGRADCLKRKFLTGRGHALLTCTGRCRPVNDERSTASSTAARPSCRRLPKYRTPTRPSRGRDNEQPRCQTKQ